MNKTRQYSIAIASGIFAGVGVVYGIGGEIITAVLFGTVVAWIGALDWSKAIKSARKLAVKMHFNN